MTKGKTYWVGYALRLRTLRAALDITEQEAAAAHSVTVETYRKWEAGGRQKSAAGFVAFSEKYDVNLDWLLGCDGIGLKPHLSINKGNKVAILPVRNAPRAERRAKIHRMDMEARLLRAEMVPQ